MVVWCSQGSCTGDIWFLVVGSTDQKRVHFTAKQVFMWQKNAATELIIYSKSSECALVEGMITYSWKNLLPDLHFFKVGTHINIWGGGTLPFTRATSFVQQWCTWTWWTMTVSTSCSTLNHCLLYNITNTLVMSELTLKNSEVSIISEKTRESACAILPNKTLPKWNITTSWTAEGCLVVFFLPVLSLFNIFQQILFAASANSDI